YPGIDITIIDSLNKRINFLNILANELELSGVHFFHGRAEDFGQDKVFRAKFDIVTARAVARMQVLAELTIPFLKVNGRLIALKAAAAEKEEKILIFLGRKKSLLKKTLNFPPSNLGKLKNLFKLTLKWVD
ncbi:Unknown, partial [Streptococcus agalactiae COH1]